MIYITTSSPERAWEPFLAWLRDHGIDPFWCYQVALSEEDLHCVAYMFDRDENGQRYLVPGTDSLATYEQPFTAQRPVPRRLR